MLCPNCNKEMKENYCMRCGYMDNGNFIDPNKKNSDKHENIRIYNSDFEKMYRNHNSYLPFIFGPLYFSIKGHFWLGFVGCSLDMFLLYSNNILLSKTLYFSPFVLFGMIFYLISSRLLYATLANAVCLFFDNYKISKIKDKYKENYKNYLKRRFSGLFVTIMTFIVYLIIILIWLIYKNYNI